MSLETSGDWWEYESKDILVYLQSVSDYTKDDLHNNIAIIHANIDWDDFIQKVIEDTGHDENVIVESISFLEHQDYIEIDIDEGNFITSIQVFRDTHKEKPVYKSKSDIESENKQSEENKAEQLNLFGDM